MFASAETATCPFCSQSFANEFQKQLHIMQTHSGDENQLLASIIAATAAAQQSPERPQGYVLWNDLQSPTKPVEERHTNDLCDKDFEFKLSLLQNQLMQQATGKSPQLPFLGNLLPPMQLPFLSPHSSLFSPLTSQASDAEQASLPAATFASAFGLPTVSTPSANAHSSPASQTTPRKRPCPNNQNYCNLCDKELCNKYFLRTHMFKKHGIVMGNESGVIVSPDIMEREKQGAITFRCELCTTEVKTRQDLSNHKRDVHGIQPVAAPVSGSSSSGSNSQARTPKSASMVPEVTSASDNAFFGSAIDLWANTTASQPSFTSTMSPVAANVKAETIDLWSNGAAAQLNASSKTPPQMTSSVSPVKSEAASMPIAASDFSISQSAEIRHPSPEKNAAGRCAFCPQSFPNELEKQLHMIQSHTGNDQQLFASLAAAAAAAQQSAERQQRTPTKSPEERNACDICDKEFDSKLNLLQHQLLQHGGGANAAQQNLFGNLLPPMHLPFLPQQNGGMQQPRGAQFNEMEQASLAAAALAAQLGVPNMGASSPIKQQPQTPQQSKQPKRQYSSTSKNFCDLCNKEVCNKYFLRTHMLKMHNIVIDENKSVIANIDTLEKEKHGALTFRCDMCMIEMKSRQALRDHKREAHGVQPLMTPTSGGGESGSNSQARTPKSATFPSDGTPAGDSAFFGSAMDFLANSVAAQSRSDSQTPPGLAASGALLGKPEADDLPAASSENAEPNTLENNEHSSNAQVAITCNFCPQNFSNELQKQLHIIQVHSSDLLGAPYGSATGTAATSLAATTSSAASDGGASMSTATGAEENDVITQLMIAKASEMLLAAKGGLVAPQKPKFNCSICARSYKSKATLKNHMNTIHNNMVARISPSKPSARPVISPKKAKKLRSCFTCMKCSRRFATRAECSEHIVTHLRAEKSAAAAALQEHNASEAASSEATKAPSASSSPAPMDLTVESSQAPAKQQPTEATTITEQDEYDEAMLCAYMREDTSEHAEDVECGQAVTDVVNQIYEDRCRKRTYSMVNKEEKHSHTSGSTSPLSVHIPEGYAQPLQQDAKPFTMQSFLMRPIQVDGFKPPVQVLEELVAFLPVRTTVSEPIKVTFELLPTPQVDEKIQHL